MLHCFYSFAGTMSILHRTGKVETRAGCSLQSVTPAVLLDDCGFIGKL